MLDSREVVRYLSDTVKYKNLLLQGIRWRSGELRLFRDIIFAFDESKNNAKNSQNSKSTFWWNKLKKMATDKRNISIIKSAFDTDSDFRKLAVKNMPIPVATMIISREDVDNIKKVNGIDLLERPKSVKSILDTYMLLNFIIVDENTEVFYRFDENSISFVPYRLNALKNNSGNSNKAIDIKDLVALFKR